MTDSTTPVQDELLGRIAAASNAGKVEELRSLVTKLPVPTPPPSTLRIVDLAQARLVVGRGGYTDRDRAEFDVGYIEAIATLPDPMTLIEREVHEWIALPVVERLESLLIGNIRFALTGA